MRVISQNGNDYPYDSIAVSCEDRVIYARPIFNVDRRYLLAQYSTPEKAEKAMQRMFNCYEEGLSNIVLRVFRFPRDDEL